MQAVKHASLYVRKTGKGSGGVCLALCSENKEEAADEIDLDKINTHVDDVSIPETVIEEGAEDER